MTHAHLPGADLIEYLEIDDPVTAIPIHCFGGVWGLLVVGLLADKVGSDYLIQVRVKSLIYSEGLSFHET